MKVKRCLALLAALLMLAALFSACSQDTADNSSQEQTNNIAQNDKTDDKEDSGDDNDAPVEQEIVKITWLARGTSDNYQKAVDGEYENLRQCVEVQHKYGFEIESSFTGGEAFASVLASFVAAGNIPDAFPTYGALDNNTIVEWINSGMLLSCSEVLEYSCGNMTKAFGDEGLYDWGRALATHTDGDWYFVVITNNPARAFQITEADGPLRVVCQNHGVYSVMIRQDWLDDLGLSMPQTAEEYYEACLMMNQQDVNGNGQNDERIIMGLGTEYQNQGVGLWFGLPYLDFFSDPSSGEVEVAMLCEGYGDWATYLNRFYTEGMLYNGEGGNPWANASTFIAENNVISWWCQPNNIWSTGRTAAGDEDCNYQPMPIIAAVDGVLPRVTAQEATSASTGISFSAEKCTPEKAAMLVDYVYSYEAYLLFYYGVEGKAWEYDTDGTTIIDYTSLPDYKSGDIAEGDRGFEDVADFFMGFSSYIPTARDQDLWSPIAKIYGSAQEAIDAGEPYAEAGLTEEIWMEQNGVSYVMPNRTTLLAIANYGEENINFAPLYDYATLPTAEEAAIQAQYATDLKTYVQEVGTKLIIGDYDVADLQSYIDYAFDTLGLQEYLDAQQARVDRFMDAMGL